MGLKNTNNPISLAFVGVLTNKVKMVIIEVLNA
jgi:hypothetical protein